jgi:hypothetical protein
MMAIQVGVLPATNDPGDGKAFAFGPMMLFRRDAYETIGGHAAVAAEVVEDIALAYRIKQAGLGLQVVLSGALAEMRMYPAPGSLWEGWSKNWFVGLNRNMGLVLAAVAGLLLVAVVPWLAVALGLLGSGIPVSTAGLWLGLGGAGIVGQMGIRWQLYTKAGLGWDYWWLTWLGGLMTVAIVVNSVYSTVTGRGWTWRGRSLSP